MGCDHSVIKPSKESKAIDNDLKNEKKNPEIKLLLLGTGDSGKSTFTKQMKILHKHGFTKTEQKQYSDVLKENTLSSVQSLIREADQRAMPLKKQVDEANIRLVTEAMALTTELAEAVKLVWNSKIIQKLWKDRSSFQVPQATEYYLQNLERIAKDDFVPTDEDILRAKLKTTGVWEMKFDAFGKHFLLVDVGGQRSERRKWVHCFDNIDAIIYLAAIDEFDMRLQENNLTHRMDESFELFTELVSSNFLSNRRWILFLNKVDLFKEKFENDFRAFKKYYSEYTGEKDWKVAIKYIESEFKKRFAQARGDDQILYVYVTCAIDTTNVEKVFATLKHSVMMQSLEKSFIV
mmetsp:Transcript_26125/g.29069  ORF Transcript_26125/g.29069 Transcript_26125/m.29069 type:complete len:349 (+) Transcript_26125:97-1143(+)|eukprot:CAMPEP_0168522600 /NCGR_PEP_ID=MMETSP0405-20121227/9443_1 /TAXON_ID=498012 /ORGANISM="Trichosphaerium sp, Strain Am-I-7 wt" /LENGTH=348 /DNA_ID=CAMNT_0008544231 /DNA_START=90 /DNA_END=1136 /DNA_ORIENTATION=+